MPTAHALRYQIERSLETRFPAALTPMSRVHDVAASGIEAVDRLLHGGFPLGAISEITGPVGSGRTSLALTFLAERTAEERVCAWVDVHDALDPESAAANGVDLHRLLWVRCRDVEQSAAAASRRKPWSRLDQALRATDLLLQAAGFACIVLDLGDTAPEHGTRIPLATWFRFRQAADRTRCTLLILGKARYAQSSAALAVDCAPLSAEDRGGTVLHGLSFHVERGRQRFTPSTSLRKPPASTWSAGAAWERERQA